MAKVVREPLLTIYSEIRKYKLWIIASAAAAIVLLALGVHWKLIVFFPPLFLLAVFSTVY